MENYVTIVHLPQDEEIANILVEILEDKHVEAHTFAKVEENNAAIIADIKQSSCLIILHISENYDYRDYIKEIVCADNRIQIVACYLKKVAYQTRFSINEIECNEGYPLEALANDICCIMVGGYSIRVTPFNKEKLKKEALRLFSIGHYVWSLCLLLKVFKITDLEVKEKIAAAYSTLMNCDKSINYYSICLPVKDEYTQGVICNNLGWLYTVTKNLEFAEKYLKMAIDLGSPDALFNLGYLYETSWSFDSKMKKSKEAFEIYMKVLELSTTSESSKERAKERLKAQADKLLSRRSYAAALPYYKSIGDGAKQAECLRNIKLLRQAYEERRRKQAQK